MIYLGGNINPITKLFLVFCFLAITFAQWSDSPDEPLLIGVGIQPQAQVTSNGDVYFVWLTDGSYHVYLQKLN